MSVNRMIVLGAAVALVAWSCGQDAPPPPSRTAPAVQTGPPLLVAPGDRVAYAVGNPHFRGRTTVEVAHDGAATVGFLRADKADRYTGQLDATALARLRATLAANDPRGFASARDTASPDEARIEITLTTGGTRSVHAYWDAEQHEMPALRQLVLQFNEIASTVSGGRVTY